MDIKLSSQNEQLKQACLEDHLEQIEAFIADDSISYYGVKALVCTELSEYYNLRS